MTLSPAAAPMARYYNQSPWEGSPGTNQSFAASRHTDLKGHSPNSPIHLLHC